MHERVPRDGESMTAADRPVLVVDNFDSFVYTLAGYLQELGAVVSVVRNDEDASHVMVGSGVGKKVCITHG